MVKKIIFTGASSFTGFWFVKELLNAGFDVIAIFTKSKIEDYDFIRQLRINSLIKNCKCYFNTKFGDSKFVKVIKENKNICLLCHHASDTTNYKSYNFDIIKAIKNNAYNADKVLNALKDNGCNKIIYTGSVFEKDEGSGSQPLEAFSLYGLSKSFSYEILKYYSKLFEFNLGKFVIPNPFGPFEEKRFTYYLMKSWLSNEVPIVNTPDYVRDNIPVSLLSKTYVIFVNKILQDEIKFPKINPSGYIASQGEFTKKLSSEVSKRINKPCEYQLNVQKDFAEPLIRINYEPANKIVQDWDEEKAWDNYVEYYLSYIKYIK